MVDEKTATRALTGRRQMHKAFDGIHIVFSPGGTPTDGWNVQNPEGTLLPVDPGAGGKSNLGQWYAESYFDTSGYTRDELTTYFESILTQEAGRMQYLDSTNNRVMTLDLVMSERFPVTKIADMIMAINTAGNNLVPSFPSSTYDWTQVQYGRMREYLPVTQGTAVQDVFAPVSDQQFGSLEATTADKLWIYRILWLPGWLPSETSQVIRWPSIRFVVASNIQKEKELEFMMRQKRSYELTNY